MRTKYLVFDKALEMPEGRTFLCSAWVYDRAQI